MDRDLLVGLGNPFHGDDAVGPVVARLLFEALGESASLDFLEFSGCSFDLIERLAGYRRAIIIDAYVDDEAEVGAVKRILMPESPGCPFLTLHTGGFDGTLALARLMGLGAPSEVSIYGIVIREPQVFSDTLSTELNAKLPEILRAIIEDEFRPPDTAAVTGGGG